jgi:RNA polymerase II-associated protein 1
MNPSLLVGDIVEKDTSASKPVTFPDFPATPSGFPKPKKKSRVSAFKAAKGASDGTTRDTPASKNDGKVKPTQLTFEDHERRRIDHENQRRIDAMTPEEIENERQELLNGLNPSLIERLLRRANLDETNEPSPFDSPSSEEPKPRSLPPEIKVVDTTVPPKTDKRGITLLQPPSSRKALPTSFNEDQPPTVLPVDLFPLSDQPEKTHFPPAPSVPDLDPSDPNFLSDLRDKFFPNTPADPTKLAWMAPIPTKDSAADKDSPYHPGQESLPISVLRFDFRGALLPPRLSRSIPVSKGLHHHGEAPEAAGYTVMELAWLARSAVPAQRCMAFQTLGRIMYRLGKGEWGGSEDDMATGIWSSFREGRVVDTLTEAAAVEGGHRGSRVYATEALWLLEQGGWRERWRGR